MWNDLHRHSSSSTLVPRPLVLEQAIAAAVEVRVLRKVIERLGRAVDDDPTLRTAYLRMLVSDVTVATDKILIYGPRAALANGVTSGVPRLEGAVPIFDRKWCPEEDSNLHALASAST